MVRISEKQIDPKNLLRGKRVISHTKDWEVEGNQSVHTGRKEIESLTY